MSFLFNKPVFTERGAEIIRNFDYSCIDNSKIVKYYYPFWGACSNYIPENASPNIISLIGFSGPVIGCFLVVYLSQSYPLIFALYALGLFIHQTFDALDGMQGKKVGMYYNATTEVFDHVCDANLLVLTCIASNYALQLNDSWLGTLNLITTLTPYYFCVWEYSYSKVARFRDGLANPTEAHVVKQLYFLVTAIFPAMWTQSLRSVLLLTNVALPAWLSYVLGFRLNEIIAYAGLFDLFVAGNASSSTIMEYWLDHHKRSKVNKAVLLDFAKSCINLIPILLFNICFVLWMVIKDSAARQAHPVLSIFTLALPWAYSILHFYVTRISYQEPAVLEMTINQLCLFIPVLTLWIPSVQQYHVVSVYACFAIYTLLYAGLWKRVNSGMCRALGMAHFWTVPHGKEREFNVMSAAARLVKKSEEKVVVTSPKRRSRPSA